MILPFVCVVKHGESVSVIVLFENMPYICDKGSCPIHSWFSYSSGFVCAYFSKDPSEM